MTLLQDVKNRISFAYGVALLVAINGFLLFLPVLERGVAHANAKSGSFDTWKEALSFLALLEIPGFVVGLVLLLMSLGLLIKSRISCRGLHQIPGLRPAGGHGLRGFFHSEKT